jgi:hypothetical protein
VSKWQQLSPTKKKKIKVIYIFDYFWWLKHLPVQGKGASQVSLGFLE